MFALFEAKNKKNPTEMKESNKLFNQVDERKIEFRWSRDVDRHSFHYLHYTLVVFGDLVCWLREFAICGGYCDASANAEVKKAIKYFGYAYQWPRREEKKPSISVFLLTIELILLIPPATGEIIAFGCVCPK